MPNGELQGENNESSVQNDEEAWCGRFLTGGLMGKPGAGSSGPRFIQDMISLFSRYREFRAHILQFSRKILYSSCGIAHVLTPCMLNDAQLPSPSWPCCLSLVCPLAAVALHRCDDSDREPEANQKSKLTTKTRIWTCRRNFFDFGA